MVLRDIQVNIGSLQVRPLSACSVACLSTHGSPLDLSPSRRMRAVERLSDDIPLVEDQAESPGVLRSFCSFSLLALVLVQASGGKGVASGALGAPVPKVTPTGTTSRHIPCSQRFDKAVAAVVPL